MLKYYYPGINELTRLIIYDVCINWILSLSSISLDINYFF